MKNLGYVKQVMFQATLVASVLFIASCDNQEKYDSKVVAEERNEEKFASNNMVNDSQFLVNVAEIHMEEIQLGKLAQQKGATTQVKELGKMMEDAHTKSLNELIALARTKSIAIPTTATNDARDEFEELNKEAGGDFDKAYTDKMVDNHEDAIRAFENASTDAHDTDIKNWASTSLPGLRKHLEKSIECQKSLDIV
tara:strand:- start:2369 stop:2956 length:588 start_codon:yes stop_codon:yes gene_type:complete